MPSGVQNYWSWAPKQATPPDAGEPRGTERGLDTRYGPDHKQVHKAVSAQAGQGSSVPVRQEEQWEPQQKEAVQMGSWSPEECAGSL